MTKLIYLILLPSFLFSCLWVDGTTIDGKYTDHATPPMVLNNIYNEIIYKVNAKTKLKDIIEHSNIKNMTPDEKEEFNATVLILEGKYKQAIDKLLKLNKKLKNKYSIASNLGTAYELYGNNKDALLWIKEGIKRDPKSHYGTEWLHVLILQTKSKLQKDPNWLKKNRIISLPSKFNKNSNITIDNKIYTINKIKKAINYQLQERIVFVKPKDPIVADLFFTLAIITAHTSSVEEALEYLKLSKLYGFSQLELLKKREAKYIKIKENHSLKYKLDSIFRW